MPEYCHNIKPFLQPKPNKNQGGDCFACALTAALQFLFPDNPPDFETVWNYFLTKYKDSDKEGLHQSWPGMKKALQNARYDGYRIDITYDVIRMEFNEAWSHAWFHKTPVTEFTRRLEGWLRSGWVAVSEINMNGDGIYNNGHFNTTDHFVILDGIKEIWEPWEGDPDGGSSLNNYIHVVCSVKGAYWIETRNLLVKHGAAAWWLCRRGVR
jgi:hypothetical protein